jgi:uncharacterized protein (DUF1684 family)
MDADQHERTIVAWRKARQERLRSPSGWLTLVDRLPLEEGDNQLPFGTITIRGDTATLGERTLRDDEPITHQGKVYELSRRGEEFAVRVKDPAAPARLTFGGLSYFPIDLAWRVVARFERYQPPRQTHHQYDTGAGPARLIPGAAHFTVDGRALTLEPVLEEQSGRLYFLFGDQTNRQDTYPAGRFLYADVPGDSDEVILDFNMAFNPPCAFTAFASCPVIPAASRLPVRIAAGEKRWPDASA